MKFTVLWSPDAENDLATLWLNADNRAEISAAADAIDAILRDDAHFLGEYRSGRVRILYSPPLAIHFEVLEDDCIARVLTVWQPLRS